MTTPPETAPAADAGPGTFSIVDPLWSLPGTGRHAVLARTSSGALIARECSPGMHGAPIFSYWSISDDPHVRPHPIGGGYDELHQLRQVFDSERAHHLGSHGTEARSEFPVGEVWYTMHPEITVEVDCKAYLDLHKSGSFGIRGELSEVPPPTEEQAWCIGLESPAARNANAIRSGLGVVQSEYWPDAPAGEEFRVLVQTGLFGDARETFTWITAAPLRI